MTKEAHRPHEQQAHRPLITLDLTRIIGCTCGWRVPPYITEADLALAMHVAIARAGESL